MVLEILDNVLLLPQLGVEEIGVALELLREPLVCAIQELGLVADALEEGVVDLVLDVVAVVPGLFSLVVLEELLDFVLELALLLIEVADDRVILLLLLVVDGLEVSVLLSEATQLLDLGCELLLLVLDLVFDLEDGLGDLLEGRLLLIVEDVARLGNVLDLALHVRVPGDALLAFEAAHELIQVVRT